MAADWPTWLQVFLGFMLVVSVGTTVQLIRVIWSELRS